MNLMDVSKTAIITSLRSHVPDKEILELILIPIIYENN